MKTLRVFLSGPGPALSAARQALIAVGVEPSDAFDFEPGELWADTITKRIRDAAFAVILVDNASPNTWVELGVCYALGKPVVIVTESDAPLPTIPSTLLHLRIRSVHSDVFRRTIAKLVHDANARKHLRRPAKRLHSADSADHTAIDALVDTIIASRESAPSQRIHHLAGELLKAAGVSAVENDPSAADTGSDFAAWSNELQPILGNPILVEVKAGTITSDRITAASHQVVGQIHRAGVGAGLLLYLDRKGRRFPDHSFHAQVYAFDLEDFARSLLSAPFAKVILRRRNEVVHGPVR